MEAAASWRVSRALPVIEGESLEGYVSRVAAAHHFPRLAEITQVGGAEVNGRQHASFLDSAGVTKIAHCLRVEPNTLTHHAPLLSTDGKRRNMFGIELAADHFQFSYRRFSPTALATSPHHRALWNLRLFPFCVETWEYLEERCPHRDCRRQQRWRRTVGIDLCDFCGEPLTRAFAEKVPHELRRNLENFVDLFHPNFRRRERVRGILPEALRAVEVDDLLTLACLLATVQDPRPAHPLGFPVLCLKTAKATSVPALSKAWPLLEGWPGAFEELIVSRINRTGNHRGDGNSGASHRFLLKCKRRELSPALRKLTNDFTDHYRAAPLRAISGHRAAHLLGSEVSHLVQMRRSGELKSVLCLDGNRFHVHFDRNEIIKLASRLAPRIRRDSVALLLGIPAYSLIDLMNRGLLQTSPVPPGRTEHFTITKDSAEALLASLEEKLGARTSDYPVKLSKLMQCLGGGPKPWAAVLAAILTRDLDAALAPGKHRIVERIYLRSNKAIMLKMFADCPPAHLLSNLIPKADLADMMSLSRPNFSRYSKYLLGDGGDYRGICPQKALDIAKCNMSTTEIAARLQVHRAVAFKLAVDRGVSVKLGGLFDRKSAFALMPELNGLFRES